VNENEHDQRQRVRHLLIIDDTEGRRAVLLEATTYSIGRDSTNSIVLHSKLVSRQHAILLRVTAPESTAYLFRIIDGDLQGKRSTNGLLINGRREFSHDLKQGDMIVFGGDTKAKYYAVSNLSDAEFAKFCEAADFSSFLSKSSNSFPTLVPSDAELEKYSEAALVRLASFPELTPNPILEIDLSGNVTYLNPAAVLQFPDIQKTGLEHPILEGLLSMVKAMHKGQSKFFVREVEISNKVFEQSVHYIFESDLIRSYVTDTTERKRAEEQLRQQAQREAVINRIVQAMRGTMVTAEVLQITVNLLMEALRVSFCLIVQTDANAEITNHYVSETIVSRDALISANVKFLQHYRDSLAQGQQIFFSETDSSLTPELLALAHHCRIRTVLIAPLLYLQDYLGSISLYQCDLGDRTSISEPRRWTVDESSLVKTIADQCAIAIHQAQLYRQVQDLNADLERQVEERTAQLQQKMQELQRLNALKDDFLSTVSHELRTPMANIKMAIHMLRQFPMETKQERYLKILAAECSRETELINDLLDLQRLEAGVIPVGLETLYIEDWLPSVLEPFQSRILQRQQTLQVQCAPNLPPLSSDRLGLERILVELLNNACKYTPTGGEVLLNVQLINMPTPSIQFAVTNQAEISDAELPRIFDKFYRIPNADPWKQGGTGLGLALVQKLVEQLQGQISVQSQAGRTTFIVELPQSKITIQ
jgi:signal transduction histidine kinase/pSer/pThr/pTyr-binding forkhead associated (FHA) protein